jgi:hypothetical protein
MAWSRTGCPVGVQNRRRLSHEDSGGNLTTFEEQARRMRAKAHHAQILLELDGEEKSLERALEVLRAAGATPHHCAASGEGDGPRVLIELSSRDMREAVRRLSEAGFVKVQGVNALQDRTESN